MGVCFLAMSEISVEDRAKIRTCLPEGNLSPTVWAGKFPFSLIFFFFFFFGDSLTKLPRLDLN